MPRLARVAPAAWSALLLAAACETAVEAPPPATPPPAGPPPSAAPAPGPRVVEMSMDAIGLEEGALDRSVQPCQDFYQFACGNWIAKAEIPADKAVLARSFTIISDRNEAVLHEILEEASAGKTDNPVTMGETPKPPAQPAARKIGAYYAACMDEGAIEAAKTKPLAPLFDLVKKVKDEKSLSAVITELHRRKIWALFDISDTQDSKDATQVIAEIDQSGLGMPDREYYLKDDEPSKKLRDKYLEYVQETLKLAGFKDKDAKRASADVMRIETELAKASKTKVERRDPHAMYNRLDRAGVAAAAPRLAWDRYFEGLGFPEIKAITVTAPRFLEAVNALVDKEKAPAWRNYLDWTVVRSLAPTLPKAFVDASFAFESALTGQKEQRPRWKRCVTATDQAVGELLAQPFVKARFSSESKEATERYVHEISVAFAHTVDKLEWMDAATKARAAEKLKAIAYLIGYPSKWKSYDFEVKSKSYLENALAARGWALRDTLTKVGRPLDRQEWHMTPPTVNAYYNAHYNHMVFPAGILQAPFFNPKASIPVNLGGMGMVVGHELTHGFDDKGSQYDGQGNLENWWSKEDQSRFKAKTDCVADQYGAYEALPGVKLNGRLTLGENIADGGGVKLAFQAYRAMRKDAPEVVVASGFNEDQQFFLGVGQAWCRKEKEELMRLRVQTDPHSPSRFRVNGPLSNLPEFAAAFSCNEGTPMRRANACSVW